MSSRVIRFQQVMSSRSALEVFNGEVLRGDDNYYEWYQDVTNKFENFADEILTYCETGKVLPLEGETESDCHLITTSVNEMAKVILRNSISADVRADVVCDQRNGHEFFQAIKAMFGQVSLQTAIDVAYDYHTLSWDTAGESRLRDLKAAHKKFTTRVHACFPPEVFLGITFMVTLKRTGVTDEQIAAILTAYEVKYPSGPEHFTVPMVNRLLAQKVKNFPTQGTLYSHTSLSIFRTGFLEGF
ncbi:conserved hypothetical protein [Lodderomyces elongisporus NRRL YB-4239]|uniref:Uncharacterized protein n=2 Tax=Lodderomyces elongisporus TaxID=36914 RepID=A5DZY7_LODEL|nr:conserved hypothetical protein [Lodderomyces elongisporus NRRL YB-4239]